MKIQEVRTGVHTYSVSMNLTAEQYYAIQKAASEFYMEREDYFSKERFYVIKALKTKGIKVYLFQLGSLYKLKICLEPFGAWL